MSTNPSRRRHAGISLIELIMFIVVVSVGIAGVLSVFTVAVKGSADPMQRKQAIAIAESLLTEILQQRFTFCDPQDPNVLTATNAGDCANDQNKGGASLNTPTPAGETRYALDTPFDNVADYGGFTRTNIDDITGNNAMSGYNASVTITRAGGAGGAFPQTPVAVPDAAALKIEVTVTYNNGSESVTLTGYRLRYAPNAAG